MIWFKWVLFGVIGLGVVMNLCHVAKGKYTHEEQPITNAIAAIIGTLLAIGILIWL